MVSGRGHDRPRASTVVTLSIVNAPSYRIAALLATGEPERLYSGLSLLVSTASDGDRCAALASFRGLDLLLEEDLLARAENADATPALSWQGRETFDRSLVELRDTALSLDPLSLYACAASVETMSLTAADVEDRLDGVMSTPRFLRETAGAQLVFV
jgi:peroxiredoxin family protein